MEKCGGTTRICYEGMVNPHLIGSHHVEPLHWVPQVVSKKCKAAIAAFDAAVDRHEAHHAADAQDILSKAKRDLPHKVQACGNTDAEALANFKAAAKKYAQHRVDHFDNEFSKRRDAFHATVEGSAIFLNCSDC